mgnify:CR=1 FL=1
MVTIGFKASALLAALALITSSQRGAEAFSVRPSVSAFASNKVSDSSTACHATRRSFLVEQTAAIGFLSTAFRPETVFAAEADDNEFIQELKARSEANREKYLKEGRTGQIGPGKIDYSQRSKYNKPKYVGVRRVDGTFKMVTPEQAEEWQKKGLVVADYDTYINKEGVEKIDYRKGLVYQFKDEKAQAQVDKKSVKPAPVPAPAPAPAPVVAEEPGPAPAQAPAEPTSAPEPVAASSD